MHEVVQSRLARWTGRSAGLAMVASLMACQALDPAPSTVQVPATAPLTATAASVVRVGVVGVVGEAGYYLAQAQGYFAQEGLSVELIPFEPNSSTPALATGQIELATGAITASLLNAVQRQVPIRIIGPLTRQEPQASGAFLVVRKDLIDGGDVRQISDLKGRKIATSGGSGKYMIGRALESAGLSLQDADMVQMDFPAMVTALGTAAVDAAYLPEPLATRAVQQGAAVKWKGGGQIVPGVQQTVVLASEHFVQQRDVAARWMTAYLRGVRDYANAFFKQEHRPQTVQLLTQSLPVKDERLYDEMGFDWIDPDGKVNLASLEDQMRWYVETGDVPAPINVVALVDEAPAAAATRRLGAYR
jgi:NitT/TauT family transport system substrate-binding protein